MLQLSVCLITFLLTASTAAPAETSKDQQIFKVIKLFNLPLPNKEIRYVSKALVRTSRRHDCKISIDTLLSVAMRESKLNRFAVGKKTKDLGIMQFSRQTIKDLHLSKKRIVLDADYALTEGCKLLSENKRIYSKTVPYWLGIYNAGTKLYRPIVVKNAKIYDRGIKRTLKKIHSKFAQLYQTNKIIAKQ